MVRAIPGSPADKGGIRPGDTIEEINGIPIGGASLEGTWARIRGPAGTAVRLTLSRQGAASRAVTLTRQGVRRSEVECPAIRDRVAYVRLTYLAKTTGDSLRNTLATLTPADAPLRGLVLDLRDNPGGDPAGAVEVANLFLKSGRIVFVQSRTEHLSFSFVAAAENATSPDLPLALLVNNGTAGFAQIVAAALQDHRRAAIVGAPTAGNGDIQYRFGIGNGTLLLTTSRALRLSDKPLDRVTPDITVPTNIHSLKEVWHPCSASLAPPEEDDAILFAIDALRPRQ